MFNNICQKFISADDQLRTEIKQLLAISAELDGNQRIIEFQNEFNIFTSPKEQL